MTSFTQSDGGIIPLAIPDDYNYREAMPSAQFSHVLKSTYIGPIRNQMQAKSLLRFTGSEHKY